MRSLFATSATAMALEEEAAEFGAKLVGLAESGSNANTEINTGEIRIAANKSAYEAALSYAYELTNVKNRVRYQKVTTDPDRPMAGDSESEIKSFLMRIFQIEAESILNRALVTIEAGWEEQEAINNPKRVKYLKIAKNGALSYGEKLDAIAELMYEQGTVGSGELVREVYKRRFLRKPF